MGATQPCGGGDDDDEVLRRLMRPVGLALPEEAGGDKALRSGLLPGQSCPHLPVFRLSRALASGAAAVPGLCTPLPWQPPLPPASGRGLWRKWAGWWPRYGGRAWTRRGGGEARRRVVVVVGKMLETAAAAAAAEPELDPEDLVHFSVGDLPSRGYGVMGEIRRQGKLCDVTLKVRPGPGAVGGPRCLRGP